MTPTDLHILVVTLFTRSSKVRFSSSLMPKKLAVEIFVRIQSLILLSNTFFWLEIIVYEVLLTWRESLLVLSQLSTRISSILTVARTLLISLSDAKTVFSSAK